MKRSSIARLTNQSKYGLAAGPTNECDEEEDEETLQLQLAAIEAKLKLKRLRDKRNGLPTLDQGSGSLGSTRAAGKENHQPLSRKVGDFDVPTLARASTSTDVQIPVSPQRKHFIAEEVKSPGRILLGIDKGLKGRNISLRRPVGEPSKDDDPFRTSVPPNSVPRTYALSGSTSTAGVDQSSRPKSFSEKIAETRQQDKALKERRNNLRKQRSTGFGVDQEQIDGFQNAAEIRCSNEKQGKQGRQGEFSKDEILEAASKANGANGGQVHRSNTGAGIRRSRNKYSTDIWVNPNAPPEAPEPPPTKSNAAKRRPRSLSPAAEITDTNATRDSETPESLFEPFSSLHLSKRLLPHDFLTRTLSGKHVFLLPDLLGAVKSPDFLLPDIPESDHVVLAIIASKSSPLNHKGAHKSTSADSTSVSEAAKSEQNNDGKYMVLTLTNLKWTIDLFLFNTGFTRFRKLTPGTVVALLNPEIMPPKPGRADTGRFSLKLSSSDDTVLEIGTSRDLGWCKSVRKDGKQCDSWIDKRHTEFCEFHVDIGIERTRRGRMEVQGMSAPFAPGGRKRGRTGYFGDKRHGGKPTKEDAFAREGPQYDRGSASTYFIAPSIPGQSAAQLLDAEGATDRYGSKEERVRKRLAERERENEIAKKLGEGGNGAGSQYLRMKQGLGSTLDTADPQAADPVDATSLGLVGNKARDVHLSPIRKRKGGTLEAERERKKTRFVTDKGIKEAGRESFGGGRDRDDDDEDGLEVV